MSSLEIRGLHVAIENKEIVKGLSLTINSGEVHAIMGPNGTGKSTLSKAIAGHPDYSITQGDVLLDGKSILELEPDERARAGLFLAFQYPSEIPGVSIANFLRAAVQARMAEGEELDASAYYKRLYQKMDMLKIDRKFTSRSVNDGFSGGEKKRCEILQMAMLEPKFSLMDETDSGPRHRRAAHRCRRRQHAARSRTGRAAHHPLSAAAELHRPRPRPCHVRRTDREEWRQVARAELESRGYDWVKNELVHA
jgi:Fe-S cluster assembly ATP-binding protein